MNSQQSILRETQQNLFLNYRHTQQDFILNFRNGTAYAHFNTHGTTKLNVVSALIDIDEDIVLYCNITDSAIARFKEGFHQHSFYVTCRTNEQQIEFTIKDISNNIITSNVTVNMTILFTN